MDVELKKKWVDALRSGDYRQGMGKLTRYGRFCCIGVLCEFITSMERHDSDDYGYNGGVYDTSLPYSLASEMGLIRDHLDRTGVLPTTTLQDYLISMNDFLGKSFNEIADYIESVEF